jgi:hypothetical protein
MTLKINEKDVQKILYTNQLCLVLHKSIVSVEKNKTERKKENEPYKVLDMSQE